jgi:hypothetical protein
VEGAGRRELAELVTDHFLGNVDRDVLLPVVDPEGRRPMARSIWKGPFIDGYLLKKADAARGASRNEVDAPTSCGCGGSTR